MNRELNELVLILAPTTNSKAPEATNPERVSKSQISTLASSSSSTGGRVVIRPIGVPVQKVGEVLGVNVFLSLRSPTKSQELDESLFYRLIGANPTKSLYAMAIPTSTTVR